MELGRTIDHHHAGAAAPGERSELRGHRQRAASKDQQLLARASFFFIHWSEGRRGDVDHQQSDPLGPAQLLFSGNFALADRFGANDGVRAIAATADDDAAPAARFSYGVNLSVAVAVGFIALAGVAAETGVVMLIYLDNALTELQAERAMDGDEFTREDLYTAIMAGAVERVRPKMMTVAAIMAGLLPIMWSHGTGAEVMQRIAVPMIGGMVSSTILTLVVIPAIYSVVKGFAIRTSHLIPASQRP